MRVNNLEQLETELRKRINNALVSEVDETVKETMMEHIISDVYEVYDPVLYTRRLNSMRNGGSGLLDGDNIKSELKSDLLLAVKNVTLGDKYVGIRKYNLSGGYTSTPEISQNYNKPIAGVIETGQGYDIDGWEYNGVPRPFIRNTCDDLRDNHYHTMALKEGLERQGLEVK